jgi:hypothetical protein
VPAAIAVVGSFVVQACSGGGGAAFTCNFNGDDELERHKKVKSVIIL